MIGICTWDSILLYAEWSTIYWTPPLCVYSVLINLNENLS
jgi:hypothetical protein